MKLVNINIAQYISLGLYSCTLERYYVTSAKFMDVFKISCFE